MRLRPYQHEAVDAVYNYLCNPANKGKNPCVEICTGGGKTVVFSQIVKDTVERWNGRVLVLTHVKELIEQGAEKLRLFCPNLKIGIYSAGLGRRDTEEQVVIAGIQSVYKRAQELGSFDLVLIDECHLLPPSGDGMYRTLLSELKAITPHQRVVGFTATPYRTESGPICSPDGILNDICFSTSIRLLIQDGYLSKIRSKASRHAIDTETLGMRGGEFVAAEVERKVNAKDVVERACREIVEQTRDRKAVILFCTSVSHCKRVAQTITALSGEECGIVTADTPASERAELLQRIRGNTGSTNLLGEAKPPLKFLANVNVCAVGFDAPNIDCVALLRPTASPGLYVQMAGRGLRLAPGKEDCLVLDYGENILRHGPLDDVCAHASNRKKRKDVRVCPSCNEVLRPKDTVCPACGFVFEPKAKSVSDQPPHRAIGSAAAILSDGKRKERPKTRDVRYTVLDVEYAVHHSQRNPESPPSLRVTFVTKEAPYRISIWKFPQGNSPWQRQAFARWWKGLRYDETVPVPRTAQEAVDAIEIGAALRRYALVLLRYTEGNAIPREIGCELKAEPSSEEVAKAIADFEAQEMPF